MHILTAEEYEKILLEKFKKEEIDEKVREKISDYAGLLTREAALYLLAKENKLLKEVFLKLVEIKPEYRSVNFRARVKRIYPTRVYPNGKRSVRILLGDESGEGTLVLWNENADLVRGSIGVGDKLEVRGAYMGEGELHLGYEGKIQVLERAPPVPIRELREGFAKVRGIVKEINPDYFYVRGEKEYFMSSFQLSDKTGEVRVALWHSPEQVRALNKGDEVEVENGLYKNKELHVNEYSRIVIVKRADSPNIMRGEIKEMRVEKGGVLLSLGEGKEVVFVGERALHFLGIRALPPGIKLETIVELKKEQFLGKRIIVKIKKGAGG